MPNSLVNSLCEIKCVLFYAGSTQLCCFITFLDWELLIFSITAYDRYVAFCNPLLNVVLMSRNLLDLLDLLALTFMDSL